MGAIELIIQSYGYDGVSVYGLIYAKSQQV